MEAFVLQNKWWILGSLVMGYASYRFLRRSNLPPGPLGLPLVGAMFEVSEDTIHLDLTRLGEKYGEIYSIPTGRQLTIILNSYRLIKEAFLQRGGDFADRPGDTFDPYTMPYNNMFMAHKKIGMKALRNFGYDNSEAEQRMTIHIDNFIKYLEEQNGELTYISPTAKKMCACIINEIVFGEHNEFDDDRITELVKICSTWVNLFFTEAVFIFFYFDMLPDWMGKIFFRRKRKIVIDATNGLLEYMKGRIRAHQENASLDDPQGLVDMYLKAQSDDGKFSFDYLVAAVMMFIPDAIDSMAHQIGWMVLILSQRPKLQKELQEELDEVCGDRPITLADRNVLVKLSAFLLEVYRFSSLPVTSLPHCALKDGVKLDCYDIPRKATIFANLYGIHFNPEYFPDPYTFRLDHFLGKDGKITNADKFMVFGIGRRMCMGEQVVRMQMFLVTTNLLSRFSFVLPADSPAWKIDFKNIGGHFRKPPKFLTRYVPRSFVKKPKA